MINIIEYQCIVFLVPCPVPRIRDGEYPDPWLQKSTMYEEAYKELHTSCTAKHYFAVRIMPSRSPVNTSKPNRRRPSVSLLVSLHVNRGASPQISILSIAPPPLVCAILSIAANGARIRSESGAACWRTMQHKSPWV